MGYSLRSCVNRRLLERPAFLRVDGDKRRSVRQKMEMHDQRAERALRKRDLVR